MIKRTIEISRERAHLAVRDEQLLIIREGEDPRMAARVPCEDIGVVVVDERSTSYSHSALSALAEHGAALVVCGRDHLPVGVLLPMGEHTEVVWRIGDQVRLRPALRKRLWQQVVRAKIRAQAWNLPPTGAGSRERGVLLAIARGVKVGDAGNAEAWAARAYWKAWLEDGSGEEGTGLAGWKPAPPSFRRDPDGAPPNNLLNYGYAVMRAAVARSLVGAGLLPALGIKHAHRGNAFCLADDLVEPLRPLVDARVRELWRDGKADLTQPVKASLLSLLAEPVYLRGGPITRGPLMVALHRMVGSLARCYERGAPIGSELEIPTAFRPGRAGKGGGEEGMNEGEEGGRVAHAPSPTLPSEAGGSPPLPPPAGEGAGG